jgi:hypothetical protein
MRWIWSTVLLVVASPLLAADPYSVEPLQQGPPEGLSTEIRASLNSEGYRVLDGDGKVLADLWLRKSIPATSRPAGTEGVIQFPFLQEGELLGAIRFESEGHDYRDQTIVPGLYTARYGLQPVNGDHLGVSPYRDYVLLLPASKDQTLALPPRKQLESQSAEAAGSSHPACFFMLAVPTDPAPSVPSMIHDEDKETWRVVVPLRLEIQGESSPITYPVSIILVGFSEA